MEKDIKQVEKLREIRNEKRTEIIQLKKKVHLVPNSSKCI